MDMTQMAPFIGIGVVVLMAIIIVPLVLRKTRKKQNDAQNFFPELAQKTGLRVDYDKLVGNYKGYDVSLQYKVNINAMSAYKLVSSGKSNVYGTNAVYPQIHVQVKRNGERFPAIAIYDKPGMFMYTSQWIQDLFTGKHPDYPKMNVDGDQLKKGVDLYGVDESAAHQLMSSAELKNLLSTWKYTDIRLEGDTCKLTLDNNSVAAGIGIQKMYTHDFAIQALDIAVAAASAVVKN
ncbi:MAG: hypothetical protein ACOZCO_12615 [Bacteroidota bacterium]